MLPHQGKFSIQCQGPSVFQDQFFKPCQGQFQGSELVSKVHLVSIRYQIDTKKIQKRYLLDTNHMEIRYQIPKKGEIHGKKRKRAEVLIKTYPQRCLT